MSQFSHSCSLTTLTAIFSRNCHNKKSVQTYEKYSKNATIKNLKHSTLRPIVTAFYAQFSRDFQVLFNPLNFNLKNALIFSHLLHFKGNMNGIKREKKCNDTIFSLYPIHSPATFHSIMCISIK